MEPELELKATSKNNLDKDNIGVSISTSQEILYTCNNGNCNSSTNGNGTYYENSCHIYCQTSS